MELREEVAEEQLRQVPQRGYNKVVRSGDNGKLLFVPAER